MRVRSYRLIIYKNHEKRGGMNPNGDWIVMVIGGSDMKKLVWIAASLLLVTAGAASAHPRLSMPAEGAALRLQKHKHIMAEVGEPRARVRNGSSADGMTPLAFAQWMSKNPGLAQIDRRMLERAPNTALLNRTAPFFMQADSNGDGRISAIEVADFVSGSLPADVERSSRMAQRKDRIGAKLTANP